jgi:hypothetical protein
VGFKPTIPASERAMTVHALDRAATVIVSDYYSTRQERGIISHSSIISGEYSV